MIPGRPLMNNDELKTERQKDRTHTQKKLDFRSHIECRRMSENVGECRKRHENHSKDRKGKYMDKDKHKENNVRDAGECQGMSENVRKRWSTQGG